MPRRDLAGLITLTTLLCSVSGFSAATSQETPPPTAQEIVESFFERLNALDGSDASVAAFVALYQEDAQHITGPESHQLGTVTFDGHRNLRKMARDIGTRYSDVGFRIETITAREQTVRLFHQTEGPWGGSAVAVEYVAAVTRASDGRRLFHPGAAFFQIRDGKIRRVRIYMSPGEQAEVEPLD